MPGQGEEKILIAFRVIFGDPSDLTGGDAFAWVGAQLKLNSTSTIEFKLAKQFWKEKHSNVAAWAKRMHKQIKPNFMGLESNRKEDKRILKLYRTKFGMKYLQGVNTSSHLTEKTRQMGYAMDKVEQTDWLRKKMERGEISFPADPGPDMQELIDQIPQIVPMMTQTGQTTVRAQRGRHDDLFIAALHCTNIIRLFIEEQERLK